MSTYYEITGITGVGYNYPMVWDWSSQAWRDTYGNDGEYTTYTTRERAEADLATAAADADMRDVRIRQWSIDEEDEEGE